MEIFFFFETLLVFLYYILQYIIHIFYLSKIFRYKKKILYLIYDELQIKLIFFWLHCEACQRETCAASSSNLCLLKICISPSPSQSVPTILVLKTWVGLWPSKKSCPKYGPEKSKVKKTGSLWFKNRRGQAASSLFE